MEELEARRLLAAGDIDPTFGQHNGAVDLGIAGSRLFDQHRDDGRFFSEITTATDANAKIQLRAADGSLVTSFGNSGTADVGFETAADVEFDASGRVLIAGYNTTFERDSDTGSGTPIFHGFVQRLLADGTPDPSFGTNGIVDTEALNEFEVQATQVFPRSDGSLIVNMGDLVHLNENGSLNPDFRVINGERWRQTSDGFVGTVFYDQDGHELPHGLNLIKAKSDGALDSSFGTNGFAHADPQGVDWVVADAPVLADGKILVAASRFMNDNDPMVKLIVARFNTNGSLDNTFGAAGGGFTEWDVHSDLLDFARLFVQDDGKIVVMASRVYRLSADGSKDTTMFGNVLAENGRGFVRSGSDGLLFSVNQSIVTPTQHGQLMRMRLSDGGPPAPIQLINGIISLTGSDLSDSVLFRHETDGDLSISRNGLGRMFDPADVTGARIDVGGGDDFVRGAGAGVNTTILCGDGNDSVDDGGKDDSVVCGAGDDSVRSYDGRDTVDGGDGNDQLIEDDQSSFTSPTARSEFFGGAGNDTLIGGWNPDTLAGGDGDDAISGGGGDDTLSGNAGRDTIDGGFGNDRLAGNGGRDKLIGNDGRDRLYGGAGDDWLRGDAGLDKLFGQDGHDRLFGGSSADILDGGAGDDELFGEGGNDQLIGGPGADTLHGNAGNDLLISAGDSTTDSLFGDAGHDSAQADVDDALVSIEELT